MPPGAAPGAGPSGLRHEGLEEGGAAAVPLERVDTTDRHRLGLLLQGCALLAHLDRAGWHLRDGWSGATVCAAGKLRVSAVSPGRAPLSPQARLRELVVLLFRSERVVGRGEARRVVRRLLEDWRQDVEPVDPAAAVETLLREAPFLWQEAYAVHRRALAAEMVAEPAPALGVVGPATLRRRVLDAGPRLEDAWSVLEGDQGRQLVSALGRDQKAADAGGRRVGGRRAAARAEIAAGRFEAALRWLRELPGTEGRLLRLECQVGLARLAGAKRTLRQLLADDLRPDQVLDAAELALRVHGNLGERDHARDWVARALEAGKGSLRARARVLAALESWDRGDAVAMARHLDAAARSGIEGNERSYLHARGLLLTLEGRPEEAAEQIARALAVERRKLGGHLAGRLWNDMVLARVLAGDLAGAERACRHSLRLLGGCDGPVKATLALYNLAEIRLRRGRLSGVAEILERCRRENALSGNVRGGAQDAELWARFELAHGRPREAVERCRAALERMRSDGVHWNRPELELLLARALGWLGRAGEAAELLERLSPQRVLPLLEPEERPALFALAGMPEAARGASDGTPAGELVRAFVEGRPTCPASWDAIELLEPFRGARLVFDLHLLAPERVPESRRRWAATVLRRAGASGLAVRLEAAAGGVFRALHSCLEAPEIGTQDLARLFEAAGLPEARLERAGARGESFETVLEGPGGTARLELEGSAGRWRLHVAHGDEPAETLLRLVDRLSLPGAVRDALPPTRRPKVAARAGLLGESPSFASALERLDRLAPLDLPVLLLGETGTGKELAARRLHAASGRRERAFLALNCAALSETLVLSDLFGHARGAFTGADRDRAGVFESAEGGTVFLDEIGDLPLPAQGMLLRVLQDGEVRRLGETRVRRVDVRVLAATHRDLERRIAEGSFREDLYYRLRVGRVVMPPLRERGRDVLLLADAILEELGGLRATPAAKAALARCPWPGNVRQLRAVLEAASALADPQRRLVEEAHLDLPAHRDGRPGQWHEWLDGLKRERLRSELAACGGNQAEVARRLGLTRQALSYLTRQLGLTGVRR
jgi:DNA-binding NtrC family response regulator